MAIKAVFFDFMGTCLDWHSSVVDALPSAISREEASQLALQWRQEYFDSNASRLQHGHPPEDTDHTLIVTLDLILNLPYRHLKPLFDDTIRQKLLHAWHAQPAWPEVKDAVQQIRNSGLEVFVHANGTSRLQLDLTAFSGLSFNMLLSSQLLGVYKPSQDAYIKALELTKLRPDEVVMVAAHAYDLRGAQKVGMRTIYIHRWTDDINEDMAAVRGEFEEFLEDMSTLPTVINKMR